jgi:O-antigen/teichoic acid export membrane protein
LSLFGFAVGCLVCLFYFIYCRRKYQYARFSFVYDKSLIKELSGFGGYVFGNSIFAILLEHGRNIMLNIFFGPAVNAAKGLANAVNFALLSFGNNFKAALAPQLTKSYSANDTDTVWNLSERGTRMTYFLFFIFSVPLLLETDFIFKLWLGNVPEYTVIFAKFLIIIALMDTFLFSFWIIVNASGKLKITYITTYVTTSLSLIISYLICKNGYPPYYVYAYLPFYKILITWPIYFMLAKKLFNFPIRFFAKKVIIPIFFVSIISFFPFYFINKVFSESFIRSFIIVIASMLWTGIVIMVIGLKKNERVKVLAFVKRKILLR